MPRRGCEVKVGTAVILTCDGCRARLQKARAAESSLRIRNPNGGIGTPVQLCGNRSGNPGARRSSPWAPDHSGADGFTGLGRCRSVAHSAEGTRGGIQCGPEAGVRRQADRIGQGVQILAVGTGRSPGEGGPGAGDELGGKHSRPFGTLPVSPANAGVSTYPAHLVRAGADVGRC